MKHYFFVNPVAGQGKGLDKLMAEIRSAGAALGQTCEIYLTKSVGDGQRHAEEIAAAAEQAAEPVRLYACGGDGTCNEIINAAAGKPHVAVGCVPIGTGNDTVRSVSPSEAGDFRSVRAQLQGSPISLDVISYTGLLDGVEQTRCGLNMFNIGLDCDVVALAAELKQKPLIAGPAAYLLAVAGVFIRKKTIRLRLESEGRVLSDGPEILCAVCNGSYCGGGMYTAPQASMQDGIFDVNLIHDVSRLQFLKLFPKYKKGTHLRVPGIEKVVETGRYRELTVSSADGPFRLCTDGEICQAEHVTFRIVPGALRFIVPARVTGTP